MSNQGDVLWRPSEKAMKESRLSEFIQLVRQKTPQVHNYDSLYNWSVESSPDFWETLWDYCDVKSSRRHDEVLVNPDAMPGAQWFSGARLNYAENCLRYRDDRLAMISSTENGTRREVSYRELYQMVVRCQHLLESLGVQKGDRVAGYMPNSPETIVALLATASIGAIWSSCSPDFGVKGVFERFDQIQPKVMFAIDGYYYAGKEIEVLESVGSVASGIDSIEKVVIVPFLSPDPDLESHFSSQKHGMGKVMRFDAFHTDRSEMSFAQLPFDHPLYILYSSGTTGKPKCIVHSAGGSLLQHLKEHQLHTDVTRDDRLFYFSTCGWMMWNWLVTGLASGCTLILYDGSPFYPKRKSLWVLASELKISVFGTSARYISTCKKARIQPHTDEDCDLSALRAVLSTGSPLAAESFDYVYDSIKPDVMLSSISGGTDIVSCFVLGCPLRPVHRGEIQTRGLGMAVDVYVEGESVIGQRGELVCTKPFPCMPIGFWGEKDGSRYYDAYFSRFENVWAQGDYAEITQQDGLIIYGRSDAVLNPGGVRIGTAEIYRQVEKVEEVLESLCIGQIWKDDVRIILFVILQPEVDLTDELQSRIRQTIQNNTTRRHVPKKIISVLDIPRTLSGKIVELAVRNIVHGDEVKNTEALANPEALEYFRNLDELKQ